MSLIELKRRPETTVFASVTKSSREEPTGLTLNYYDGGTILIRNVEAGSIFSHTNLKAGCLLQSINNTSVKGLSTTQCMDLFEATVGELNVSALDVGLRVASVVKETRTSKVGIGLKDRQGMILVSSVAENSMFADTHVDIGQRLMAVNGTSCEGLKKNQAIVLFKELEGLTVMTQDVGILSAKVFKPTVNTKVGIGLRSIDNCVIISSIADDSIFQGTAIKPGLRLIQVNKTDMYGMNRMQAISPFKEAVGTVAVLADDIGLIAARAFKSHAGAKVGITLRQMAGHIVISSISGDSIFANTELVPGLRLVCVDNVLCKGVSHMEAIQLFKQAQGPITVLAERVGLLTSTAIKDSPRAKVGLGLKTIKGYTVISTISPGSIFAHTPMAVGHRLVSINKIGCIGMSKVEAVNTFKQASGLVTVMTEEVGFVSATVTKNARSDKVGIGLKEVNGHIVISCIYDTGLFTKTDLKEGLRLLVVNDNSMAGLSRDQAIDLFRNAVGDITVWAEDPGERSFLA